MTLPAPPHVANLANGLVVLGLDPGLASCGWAAIRARGESPVEALAWGTLTSSARAPLPQRVGGLTRGVAALIAKYGPYALAAEEWLYYGKSAGKGTDTMRVCGAIVALAELGGLVYSEHPASLTKLTLTGRASGTKEGMQAAVRATFKLPPEAALNEHAADALAAALTGLTQLKLTLAISHKGRSVLGPGAQPKGKSK